MLSSMTKILNAILFFLSISFGISAQNIVGTWSGNLKLSPQMSLKLVFHFNEDKTATMDSPDQGAYGIEGETIYLSDDSINMKVPKLMMSYTGHRSGEQIEGTFTQGGMSLPLNLTCGEKKVNRPQTPIPPFPYSTEEVTVKKEGVTLAGTLTIPQNATKKTPVVVMVTGSGQQNRDEELFEHKPFAVIADYLARNGIATLRYDDRGVGGSTGEVATATTADFAQDAANVVEYLKSIKRFGKIGLMGHSEGGLIAYMLGATPKMLDFIISIAGPSVRGDSILIHQNKNALTVSGVTGQVADDFTDALRKALQTKIENPNATISDNDLTKIYPTWNKDSVTRQLAQGIRGLFDPNASNKWMQFFMAYSPAKDLRSIRIPTMIIYGEKDIQVPAELNAPCAHRNAPKAIVKVYPYANHLMQHAATGEIDEYKTIEETFSAEILEDITTFIKSL